MIRDEPSERSRRAHAASLADSTAARCRSRGGYLKTSAAMRESAPRRSEEHTSELQSLAYLVCRLLLEKKKKKERKYRWRNENKAQGTRYQQLRRNTVLR